MAWSEVTWLNPRVKIAQRVAPTHGVQPAAKSTPNRPELSIPPEVSRPGCALVSMESQGIGSTPNVYRPNRMTTTPPSRPSTVLYWPKSWPIRVAAPPHPSTTTSENPPTKNRAWSNVIRREGAARSSLIVAELVTQGPRPRGPIRPGKAGSDRWEAQAGRPVGGIRHHTMPGGMGRPAQGREPFGPRRHPPKPDKVVGKAGGSPGCCARDL